jgi:hypothetical protein
MELVLVHPEAALVGLAVVLPLAALWVTSRRATRVRAVLGLPGDRRRPAFLLIGATAVAAVLVSLAAANPVLLRREPLHVRTDAEAYVVLDITRSMLASASADDATRLTRAKGIARRVRAGATDVPFGLASFTNRVVPHVFPTLDASVFDSGLDASIAVEQPPPDRAPGAVLTAFDALAALQTHNFFSEQASRRVAVVVTDGETNPVRSETIQALRSRPRLDVVVIRVWDERERIHRPRRAEDRAYLPAPDSTATLRSFAAATGAAVFDEGDADRAADTVRRLLGTGEAVRAGDELSARSLAGFTFALAFVPLGYLLWRRNL